MSTGPFLLGVDPGTTTGLAGISATTGRVLFVASAAPLDAVHHVERWAASGRLAAAFVEDARRLPVYHRNRHANRGERDRIARGVGGVDLLTSMYLALLESLGVPAEGVEPSGQKKWDAKTCARVTGYEGRTNEHGRDALRLVYGRAAARPPRRD